MTEYKNKLFIEKSVKIHGDKYIYDKINYINTTTKIIIICKIHGEFLQTPSNHLKGQNCMKCSKKSKLTTKEFIDKAIKKHGDKYNYDKVNYIDAKTNVIIICKIHGEFLQNPYSHIKGFNCLKCACTGVSKSTSKLFIEKAIKKHGDKYNYNKVEYINVKTKVIIICKIHGEFLQTPDRHIQGFNCPECSILLKKKKITYTNDIFIDKANKIYNYKYDYSKVKYVNSKTKVIITCSQHGNFEHTPNNHLRNYGCAKCNGNYNMNTEEFICKANLVHMNKYDYFKTQYILMVDKVIITCPIHGDFKQQSNLHLQGSGCNKCANINISKRQSSSTEEFIIRANKIHMNKYDYSKVEYINNTTKIIIICKIHGEFLQAPSNHLAGNGCIKCSNNRFSKAQIIWLELLSKLNNVHIQHAMNDGEYQILNTRYHADGYCKETNTIYEFHGDYFHGCPKRYNANDINQVCNKTFGELYENTLKKEQIIKDLGYNLIVIWESDWNKINKSIKILQKKYKNYKINKC